MLLLNKKKINNISKEIKNIFLEYKEIKKENEELRKKNLMRKNFILSKQKEIFEENQNKRKRLRSYMNNVGKIDNIFKNNFLSSDNVIKKGHYLDLRKGLLLLDHESNNINYNFSKISENQKEITFFFNKYQVINKVFVEAYNINGKPIYPLDIKFKIEPNDFYDKEIISIKNYSFENFENNLEKNDFSSEFIITPKKTNEITIIFKEKIDLNKINTRFLSNFYTKNNKETIFEMKGTIDEENIKFSKKDESFFNEWEYYYSTDIKKEFKKITFSELSNEINQKASKNYSIIKLGEVTESLFIKIKNKEKENLEELTYNEIKKEKILLENEGFNFQKIEQGPIEEIKIQLTDSAIMALKQNMFGENWKNKNLNFINEENFLEKEFVFIKEGINPDKKNELELNNTIEMLDENFQPIFIFDKIDQKLYTNNFLFQLEIYINYFYKKENIYIAKEYYTPVCYNFSISF